MDPVGQGSFIPKQSLTDANRASGGGMGLFFLLALLIFAMSLVAAGSAFGYERLLNEQISSKDADLRLQEGAFNAGTIKDLVRIDKRLTQARTLLQKHVGSSAIFSFLSTITLERVQFDSMDFTLQSDGGATIALTGTAESFASVALQSDQFGASKVLRDVIVSNITVGTTNKVTFAVNAMVDPQLLSYSRNVGQSQNQAQSQTQTPAP